MAGQPSALTEVKAATEAALSAFEAYKAANDERLTEIEKKGSADVLTEQKVARIDNRLQGIETFLSRPGVGRPQDGGDAVKAACDWLSTVRDRPVEESEVDLRAIGDYRDALKAYLRRGPEFMSDGHRNAMAEFKALSVGAQTEGGYWVTPTTSNRIVETVFDTSPVRQVAAIEQVTSDALEIVVDKDQAAAQWVGETETRLETATPDVATARIPVHELHAQPKATQKILEDAHIDIEMWLAGKVADKFARTENTAFVIGNGVGQPRGYLDYPAVADASWSWGNVGYVATGAASNFASSNPGDVLYDTVGALKAGYRAGAVWMMNRSTLTEVRKFKDSNGRYLWQPSLAAGQPSSLLGYAVIEAEDMPDVAANALPIVFGNFHATYTIVDRLGVSVLRDPFTAKPHVLFDTRKRVGGDVVNFESYKAIKVATS